MSFCNHPFTSTKTKVIRIAGDRYVQKITSCDDCKLQINKEVK